MEPADEVDLDAAAVALVAETDQQIAEAKTTAQVVLSFHQALLDGGATGETAMELSKLYLMHFLDLAEVDWP